MKDVVLQAAVLQAAALQAAVVRAAVLQAAVLHLANPYRRSMKRISPFGRLLRSMSSVCKNA